MHIRTLIILILCLLMVLPVTAQQPTVEPTPDFFATATAIIAGATQTAEARDTGSEEIEPFQLTATVLIQNITRTAEASGIINATETVDPFRQTATAVIVQATQTGQADVLSTEEPDSFFLTATQLIRDVTATIEATTGISTEPEATNTPRPTLAEDSFQETATALVAQATQTAAAGGTTQSAIDDGQSDSPLGILITALLGILSLFGLAGVGVSQARKSK